MVDLGGGEIRFGEEIEEDEKIADETESDGVEIELSGFSFNGAPKRFDDIGVETRKVGIGVE